MDSELEPTNISPYNDLSGIKSPEELTIRSEAQIDEERKTTQFSLVILEEGASLKDMEFDLILEDNPQFDTDSLNEIQNLISQGRFQPEHMPEDLFAASLVDIMLSAQAIYDEISEKRLRLQSLDIESEPYDFIKLQNQIYEAMGIKVDPTAIFKYVFEGGSDLEFEEIMRNSRNIELMILAFATENLPRYDGDGNPLARYFIERLEYFVNQLPKITSTDESINHSTLPDKEAVMSQFLDKNVIREKIKHAINIELFLNISHNAFLSSDKGEELSERLAVVISQIDSVISHDIIVIDDCEPSLNVLESVSRAIEHLKEHKGLRSLYHYRDIARSPQADKLITNELNGIFKPVLTELSDQVSRLTDEEIHHRILELHSIMHILGLSIEVNDYLRDIPSLDQKLKEVSAISNNVQWSFLSTLYEHLKANIDRPNSDVELLLQDRKLEQYQKFIAIPGRKLLNPFSSLSHTAMFSEVAPMGPYGSQFAIRLLETSSVLNKLAQDKINEQSQIVGINHSTILSKEVALSNAESAEEVVLANSILGIVSITHAISFIAASQNLEHYENNPNQLVIDLIDQGLIKDLALILPLGFLGRVTNQGYYMKEILILGEGGKLHFSESFKNVMREFKQSVTPSPMNRGKGCPVAHGSQSGLASILDSYKRVFMIAIDNKNMQ